MVTVTITTSAGGDLRRALVEAMSSAIFPREPAILLDTRGEKENPTPDVLRLRAGWIATALLRREGSRCALVIGRKPHHYGLARMLAVFLETEGVRSDLFVTAKRAREWLPASDGRTFDSAASG